MAKYCVYRDSSGFHIVKDTGRLRVLVEYRGTYKECEEYVRYAEEVEE